MGNLWTAPPTPKSSMPRPNLVPPLPQDLQNRSFKGMNCAGWDFSGRDIRGCDFRKSNLSDADFTGVHTGRTNQQINREKIGIPIGLILGVVFAIVLMTAYKSPAILTRESIDAAARMATLTLAIGMTLMFVAVAGFQFFSLSTGLISMTAALMLGMMATNMFSLMDSMSRMSQPQYELMAIAFIVHAIILPGLSIFYYRQMTKIFRNAIGTDFQGANLSGANFTDAMLKNCAFKDADISQANWTNVETSRCDRDVTKLV
jgi:Pentapeptide repeats (8 copies)